MYICDCGPGTLVINKLNTRAEYVVATRNGDTSLIAWPGPALVSRSASGYTDIGAIARTLAVAVTGSARDSSQLRSAPVTTASTMSLTSQSKRARSFR